MSGGILPWELSTTFPRTSIRTAKFPWEAIPIARPDAVLPALCLPSLIYSVHQVLYWQISRDWGRQYPRESECTVAPITHAKSCRIAVLAPGFAYPIVREAD
jgi:hypothetical protein